MFETHFGFSAPPFQLSPDPAFYFESKGHGKALAYLKYGVHQGEGFIVVTGDVGSGKTTLVRALQKALPPGKVVVAQVVSTLLDDHGLLYSICVACGLELPQSPTKAQLQATIENFAMHLVAQGRRMLLVIDEAQNLGPREIEELRMLSNYQLSNRALLQSYLIGQPELRAKLRLPAMEPFRQRVIASCHLGPLDVADVRGYIEHRLRHVGWKDNPRLDDGVFEAVYRHTDGIPRRINVLMTRVLLDAVMNARQQIAREQIEQLASELRDEAGF
jgi:general secretion pathway protein A